MDNQSLTIIGTIIGTPLIARIVDSWLATRKSSQDQSTSRLDKLEAEVGSERLKTEATQEKLFDLAVKHEGLRVHFDLLRHELSACKEKLNGSDQAVPH